MSSVMITGGAGFVGHALSKELLEKGADRIILVDNLSRGRKDEELEQLLENPKVTFMNVDLTDPSQVAKLPTDIEYVYHLAALIGVKHVLKNPDQVFSVNLQSVIFLLEHLKQAPNLKRVLFSSTSEVYAGALKHHGIPIPTPESTPLTIDDLNNPRTSYALSKIAGEAIGFQYARVHGIPFTAVRFHNVYGPRMGFAHVIPETMIKLSESDQIPVPSPTHTRAFCYIDDAITATIACAESDKTRDESINIGNPEEEISIRNLVGEVAHAMDKNPEIEEMPDTPGSPSRRSPDITKLVGLAGFTPRVNLRDGIRQTYSWYKDRLSERFE